MKKITFLLFVLTLAFNSVSGQTVFDFDTNAVDNGNNITETIDGITVTFKNDLYTDDADTYLSDFGSWMGTTGYVVDTGSTSSTTFTFDQPVVVNSILPLDGWGGNHDYTFTPTGGDNSPVVVSIVGGAATTGTVDLNWIGVTSFTVTAPTAVPRMSFDNLSVYAINSPTVFDFDTNAVDNGNNITETIDGITVTFKNDLYTDDADTYLSDFGGWMGTTGYVVDTGSTSSTTFTFDQPVVVNSILPLDGWGGNHDYTFTPTGGDNSPVVVSIVGGAATTGTVDLNWIGVTSFTVTAPTAVPRMSFDNLSVISFATLAVTDDYRFQKVLIYPNPVANILYIKNVLSLKSIKVYNNLGQLVLQSKQETIDVSHLSKGMYFLQINSSNGTETKRIIKK